MPVVPGGTVARGKRPVSCGERPDPRSGGVAARTCGYPDGMGQARGSFPPRTWTASIPASPDAPAHARWFLWSRVGRFHPPAEMETAVLLLSELVSNAIRHGEGNEPIEVKITLDREDLRVVVKSRGSRFDPNEALHEVDGDGLRLVETLSTGWGARPTSAGMEAWFAV